MIGVLIIILISVLIRLSTQHFVVTVEPDCNLASRCNHTWTPICGQDKQDLETMLFLDECDMFEYNCDNNRTYVEVDVKTCKHKCTQKNKNDVAPSNQDKTEPPTTPVTTKVASSTETTTKKKKKKTTTTTTTESSTTQNTTVSEESSSEKDNSTEVESLSDDEETTILTTTTADPTTLGETTKKKKRNKTTTTTEATTADSTADGTSEELSSEESTTEKTTETTSGKEIIHTTKNTSITVTTKNGTCYPKDCFVPSTWETTQKAEDRDFYQILKQRFGDKVKILRDTTHFPKEGRVERRYVEAFMPHPNRIL